MAPRTLEQQETSSWLERWVEEEGTGVDVGVESVDVVWLYSRDMLLENNIKIVIISAFLALTSSSFYLKPSLFGLSRGHQA